MYKAQTVYLPVKIEDELPENGKTLAINPKIDKPFEIMYSKEENIFISGNVKFFLKDSGITHWLKPQESFVFTPEQLNEYTANVIKQALETAAEKALVDIEECMGQRTGYVEVDKQSITNTFEETFKKFKV